MTRWPILFASEQIVEGEVRHHPHTHGQRRLVGEKKRRVILRYRRVILVTRRHTEEHELARDLLLEVRKVFSYSNRWAQTHVIRTSHALSTWTEGVWLRPRWMAATPRMPR